MPRNIHNSTIVRVDHRYPTSEWIDAVNHIHFYTTAQSQGEVDRIPGPVPGQLDWLFEFEEDAAWFVLQQDGRVVDKNDPGLGAALAGFLG